MELLGKVAAFVVRLLWALILVAVAVWLFAEATDPGGILVPVSHAIIQNQVSDARARWAANSVEDFDIDVHYKGRFCFGDHGPYHLEVRKSIIKAKAPDFSKELYLGACPGGNWSLLSHLVPPDVFDWILSHLKLSNAEACPTTVTSVTFDSNYGYASSIEINGMACGESHMGFNYSNFKPVSP